MTNLPAPTVQPTAYRVSVLPEDDVNHRLYAVAVTYCGAGKWAVVSNLDECLGADGTWADGIKPYGRGDEWLAAHRFDEATALKLATEAAPHVEIMGRSAADALRARWRAEGPIPAGGNAEDCPRCAGTNPPYPFLCPGHPVGGEA
jgi:hypothetical protein